MSLAEQLADDINLLKKKYRTKKAIAQKMATYLGRARTFDSFYTYFTRHTTGKKVGSRFFINFYKIFRADLYALQSKTDVSGPDALERLCLNSARKTFIPTRWSFFQFS
jgi:hypothetical protein